MPARAAAWGHPRRRTRPSARSRPPIDTAVDESAPKMSLPAAPERAGRVWPLPHRLRSRPEGPPEGWGAARAVLGGFRLPPAARTSSACHNAPHIRSEPALDRHLALDRHSGSRSTEFPSALPRLRILTFSTLIDRGRRAGAAAILTVVSCKTNHPSRPWRVILSPWLPAVVIVI